MVWYGMVWYGMVKKQEKIRENIYLYIFKYKYRLERDIIDHNFFSIALKSQEKSRKLCMMTNKT